MSSQKKQSLWQRLKQLVTDAANTRQTNTTSTQHTDSKSSGNKAVSVPTSDGSKVNADNTSYANPHRESIDSVALSTSQNSASETDNFESKDAKLRNSNDNSSSDKQSSKFVSLANLDASDNMKRRSGSYKNSDKPITDAVLDFLEASDLSYYYHHQQSQQQNSAHEQSESSSSQNSQDSISKQDTKAEDGNNAQQNPSTVHHISMAMRYFNDADNTAHEHGSSNDNEPLDDSLDDLSTTNLNNLEWGCVIRIHEHTQLIAIYGVLPFQLPPTHLQAGMTLATQLNYDMMLGSIEIDIRDGEIRLKNSLDLEPIINTSGGIVPPAVISYLLKGLMAMTASFAPLFHDLINSDPKKFELEHLLEQLQKDQADNRFYLATTTPQ